jgi:hypothetical protein
MRAFVSVARQRAVLRIVSHRYNDPKVARRRLTLFAVLTALAIAGFWLRFYAPIGEEWRDSTGGAAYVVFWILAYASLKPAAPAFPVSLTVLLVTCCLEFLQLWHPAWLEAIRRTLPGRLLLGTTFEWSDFPPYFAGAVIGFFVLRILQSDQKPFQRERSGTSSPN